MARIAKLKMMLLSATALACPQLAVAQATTPPPADTQQPAADEPERSDVVVTGIRASLANAIDQKRAATQIVDTITAEDIGKLPDNNIAEGIQRVTGVQITRDEGEGRSANIRGLSAQTTINGRVELGANSRDYDFRNLASEFFQSIEVFKSPVASQPEGALGGTINLTTRKPLDFDKFTVSVGAEALYSDYAEKFDPRGSVFLAWQNADRTLGVSLTGTYAKRHVRSDYFQVLGGWTRTNFGFATGFDFNPADDRDAAGNPLPNNVNRDLIRPGDLRYRTQDGVRDRYGVDGTIQWRPASNLEVRVDGTYTRFVNIFRNQWFRTYSTNQTAFVPGSLRIDGTGTLLGGTFTNQQVEIDGRLESEPTNLYTAGGNVKWSPGRLTVVADVSYAKSTAKLLSQFLRGVGTLPATVQFDFRGGSTPPTLGLTNAAGGAYDLLNPALYVPNLAQDRIIEQQSDEKAARLDFSYELDGFLSAIKWGGRATWRDNDIRVATSANQATNTNNPAFYDQTTTPKRRYTFADSPINTFNSPFSWDNGLFPDVGGTFPRSWFVQFYPLTEPDVGSPPYLNVLGIRNFGGLINSVPEQSLVEEKTYALYGTLDLAGELGGMALKANVGLRYVKTESTSNGLFNNNGTIVAVRIGNDYDEWLPTANVSLEVADDVVVRLAGARVMQRPNIGQLQSGYNINLSSGVASLGNPTLRPFLADQADVSLEWYPFRGALVSLAGFYKDVKNFTTSQTFTGTIPGVVRLDGGTAFQITQPVNGGGGTIKGFEAGAQMPFTFLPGLLSGFGVIANYTYSKYDTTSGEPIPALSENSYNLIGYFERGGFSSRVAYSWRSDYAQVGEGGNPLQGLAPQFRQFEFVAPAGYLDASVSYDITDAITVMVNGTNLLNTEQIRYTGLRQRLRDFSVTDRRIAVGIRAKF